jgi:hypothetical protein
MLRSIVTQQNLFPTQPSILSVTSAPQCQSCFQINGSCYLSIVTLHTKPTQFPVECRSSTHTWPPTRLSLPHGRTCWSKCTAGWVRSYPSAWTTWRHSLQRRGAARRWTGQCRMCVPDQLLSVRGAFFCVRQLYLLDRNELSVSVAD